MEKSKTLKRIADKLNAEIIPITYKGYGMKTKGFDIVRKNKKGRMILCSIEPKSKYLLIKCYNDNAESILLSPKQINEKGIPEKIIKFCKKALETNRYI